MSAARHIHPDQLAMFIPAHELVDPTKTASYHVRFDPGATYESVKRQKIKESHTGMLGNARVYSERAIRRGETLRDSISREGVLHPVDLSFPGPGFVHSDDPQKHLPELGEGHHRVFTANELNPKMEIPVRYTRTSEFG